MRIPVGGREIPVVQGSPRDFDELPRGYSLTEARCDFCDEWFLSVRTMCQHQADEHGIPVINAYERWEQRKDTEAPRPTLNP